MLISTWLSSFASTLQRRSRTTTRRSRKLASSQHGASESLEVRALLTANLINIDFQGGSYTYTGQGVLGDVTDTRWNGVGRSGANNLAFADGSGTSGVGVSISGSVDTYSNSLQVNPILNDWIYGSNNVMNVTVTGLAQNSAYDIAMYNGFYWQNYAILGQPGVTASTTPNYLTGSGGVLPPFPSGTYGILHAAMSDASGTITIIDTLVAAGPIGSTPSSEISGMQIPGIPSTPQPPATPIDNNSAANSVAEGAANGTTVGVTAFASDPNFDAVTYTLTNNAGGRFAINPVTGVVSVANASLIDYETATSHSITVQASDGVSGTSTANFTIAVTPVNDNTPIFTSASSIDVVEGTTPVVALTATDADLPPETLNYSITDGADAAKFQITGGNQLRFINAPSFATPSDAGANNVYDVRFTVADGITTGVSERTSAWFNHAGVMGWTEAPFGNDWVPVAAVNTNATPVNLSYSPIDLPAGKMILHAGPANGGKDQSVVRWTAPSAGTLTLNTTFFKLHSTAVNTYVLKNGVAIDSGTTSSGTYSFTSGTITVAAGDTIDFVLTSGR